MSDAWDVANAAAATAEVQLRPCDQLEALDEIAEVMRATWGEEQLLPSELLRAHAYSGNVPYGAYDRGHLIGYVFGWVGVDPRDGIHTHSHMLAALPDRRH